MATIGDLKVRIVADLNNFEAQMKRSGEMVEQATKRMEQGAKLAKVALGGLATALTVEGMRELISSSLESADQMGKMAQKAGVTTESLSRMSVAAKLSDVDTQSLAQAMGKLSKTMVEAQSGTGAAAAAYKSLGISVRDGNGNLKSADVMMAELAGKFSQYADGAGKTALAMAIFGKSGANLIPMLNDGATALKENADLADKLGITLSGSTAKAAQDINDRFTTMQLATKGVANQVMTAMLPTMDAVSSMMMDAATNTDGMRKKVEGLTIVLKSLTSVAMGAVFAFNEIGKALGGIAAAVVALASKNYSGVGTILKGMKDTFNQDSADFSASMDKQWSNSASQQIAPSARAKPQMNFNPGNAAGFNQRGDAILAGLNRDYGNSLEQKYNAQNNLGYSAVDQQYLANITAVTERAARAREELAKLNISTDERNALLNKVNSAETAQIQNMGKLRDQIIANNSSWEYGGRKAMQTYLEAAQNTAEQSNKLFTTAFKGMEDALVNFVMTGKLNFHNLAQSILADLARIAVQKTIAGIAGSMFGSSGPTSSGTGTVGLYSANGSAWQNGIQMFANGGVVNSPTLFPFAGGTGLMGEAGPEAIMPLQYGADGKLGVVASGGSKGGAPVFNTTIIVNPDSGSSTKTNGSGAGRQVADSFNKMANEWALKEMRPGGLLAQAGVHA